MNTVEERKLLFSLWNMKNVQILQSQTISNVQAIFSFLSVFSFPLVFLEDTYFVFPVRRRHEIVCIRLGMRCNVKKKRKWNLLQEVKCLIISQPIVNYILLTENESNICTK